MMPAFAYFHLVNSERPQKRIESLNRNAIQGQNVRYPKFEGWVLYRVTNVRTNGVYLTEPIARLD